MSDFTAKMHQIWFWLGVRPRPTGELTALPQRSPWPCTQTTMHLAKNTVMLGAGPHAAA